MVIESFIKNSFRIQKTVFNSVFNITDMVAEKLGSVLTVNTPSPYSDYIDKCRVYGETFRENCRESVNEGLDRCESLCFETAKRGVPKNYQEKGGSL